jgi:hypothetical protein
MQTPQIVRGTGVGTGSIIAVALGFIPRHVELWNEVSGVKVTWDQQFGLAYAPGAAQGIKEKGTSSPTRVLLSSAGILPYPGGDRIQYLTSSGYWNLNALVNSSLLGAPSLGANANQIFLDGDWEIPGFTTTSSSSNTVASSGSLTFTVPGGLPWLTVGSSVLIYSTASPTNYMVATITSYSGTSLVVTATGSGGSGTLSAWTIEPQSASGVQGINYNCAGFAVDPSGQNPYNGSVVEVPAGFILGTDSDLNSSGNQIVWIATK